MILYVSRTALRDTHNPKNRSHHHHIMMHRSPQHSTSLPSDTGSSTPHVYTAPSLLPENSLPYLHLPHREKLPSPGVARGTGTRTAAHTGEAVPGKGQGGQKAGKRDKDDLQRRFGIPRTRTPRFWSARLRGYTPRGASALDDLTGEGGKTGDGVGSNPRGYG